MSYRSTCNKLLKVLSVKKWVIISSSSNLQLFVENVNLKCSIFVLFEVLLGFRICFIYPFLFHWLRYGSKLSYRFISSMIKKKIVLTTDQYFCIDYILNIHAYIMHLIIIKKIRYELTVYTPSPRKLVSNFFFWYFTKIMCLSKPRIFDANTGTKNITQYLKMINNHLFIS